MSPQLQTAIEAVLVESSRCSVDVHGFYQYFDREVMDRLRDAYDQECST
jgi:hypothetical protein